MAGSRFEIIKRRDGKFQGRLITPNGATVVTTRIRNDVLGVKVDLACLRDAAKAGIEDLSGQC